MASNSFLALRSLPRRSGANGSASMSKAIMTNLIRSARNTGWMPIFAASLNTNTAINAPYAKSSSTSGSNASHTIDQSDYRMFLIHLLCRKGRSRLLQCQTNIIHRDLCSTDAAGKIRRGGYIKIWHPRKGVASVTMQNEIPQTLPKMVHWRAKLVRRSHKYHRPSTLMQSNNVNMYRLLRPNKVHRSR